GGQAERCLAVGFEAPQLAIEPYGGEPFQMRRLREHACAGDEALDYGRVPDPVHLRLAVREVSKRQSTLSVGEIQLQHGRLAILPGALGGAGANRDAAIRRSPPAVVQR